ncbi:MAG TPA: hypothetical protein VGE45_14110 [Chloroflexia bacterium]|jgi:DNA-binding beta-propeller fold protein YncE
MGRFEISCRRFAVLSGVQQEPGDFSVCIHPRANGLQRKGTLALLTEPAGDHPSLGAEACKIAQEAIIEHYYADHTLSMTSSLLSALESANSALLQHNYGHEGARNLHEPGAVAVRAGGVKTRRAKVGLTAVLVRPDATGVYLAQLAPTQAYILHNGIISAIPERPAQQIQPGSNVVPLRRVRTNDEGPFGGSDVEESFARPSISYAPLGSGPSIDTDLIYRRVEPGDMIVLVSSSLARYLDYATIQRILSYSDADMVAGALYTMATELGMAEAHACVLHLGVSSSSGVESDYTHVVGASGSMPLLTSEDVAASGGVQAAPHGPQTKLPSIRGALRGSKDWIVRRRKDTPIESDHIELDEVDANPVEEHFQETEPAAIDAAPYPTEALVQRSLDIPPYQAASRVESEEPGAELEFDGWEDEPPALEEPWFLKPRTHQEISARPTLEGMDPEEVAARLPHNGNGNGNGVTHTPTYPVPELFDPHDGLDGEDSMEEPVAALPANPTKQNGSRRDYAATTRASLQWARNTVAAFLPERVAGPRNQKKGATKFKGVPVRLFIGAGLVILAVILLLSVLATAGSQKQAVVTNYLQEAKQEDLLANQPGISPEARQQHLTLALEKARQAQAADPKSAEASRLTAKVQSDLDALSGIVRLTNVNLLFDLAEADKAAGGEEKPASPAGATSQAHEIVMQGNDAYILDKSSNRVYRCSISAKNCTAILRSGDSAGGQKVGPLVAMTMRVGNVVALDDNLTAYVYNTDISAWEAQPLGEAANLEKPKDIASYDGHLYLLAAKPGQVSKYVAGRYGEAPDDWLKDVASIEQVQGPVSMAIDGAIYVLLADGKILAMQGGKVVRVIPAQAGGSAPTSIFTSTDTRDLYVLHAQDGTITKISKEGQTIATLKPPPGEVSTVSGMTVDEGRGKLYLLEGRRVYEAALPGSVSQGEAAAPAQQPGAKPTAAP